jgi:hypothetical protein
MGSTRSSPAPTSRSTAPGSSSTSARSREPYGGPRQGRDRATNYSGVCRGFVRSRSARVRWESGGDFPRTSPYGTPLSRSPRSGNGSSSDASASRHPVTRQAGISHRVRPRSPRTPSRDRDPKPSPRTHGPHEERPGHEEETSSDIALVPLTRQQPPSPGRLASSPINPKNAASRTRSELGRSRTFRAITLVRANFAPLTLKCTS